MSSWDRKWKKCLYLLRSTVSVRPSSCGWWVTPLCSYVMRLNLIIDLSNACSRVLSEEWKSAHLLVPLQQQHRVVIMMKQKWHCDWNTSLLSHRTKHTLWCIFKLQQVCWGSLLSHKTLQLFSTFMLPWDGSLLPPGGVSQANGNFSCQSQINQADISSNANILLVLIAPPLQLGKNCAGKHCDVM